MTTKRTPVIRDIYEKFCNGDPLTTGECEAGFELFGKMAIDLRLLGPKFELTAKELLRVANGLSDYIEARKRNG